MSETTEPGLSPAVVERYRAYLTMLAGQGLSPGLRDRLDVCGVVQQTVLEACHDLPRFQGEATPTRLAAWLRRILARNLADAMRAAGAAKRDAARERSLELELDQTSARLGAWLTDGGPSPSKRLRDAERAVALATVMEELPAAQREALVLQHWHGRTLKQIAEQMGKTPVAVAGLLKRGLRHLRERLGEDKP